MAEPTVLLGWELGKGLSYAQPLRRIATELATLGARPVLALRNLEETWSLIEKDPFTILQAPYVEPPGFAGPGPFRAVSYADVLALWGFSSELALGSRTWAWDRLLDQVRPVFVVCTCAHGLVLAASGRCPVLDFGTGFHLPPLDGATFPRLREGPSQMPGEERLLEVVRAVQTRRGAPLPLSLPGAFAHAERFLTVLPELDPYRALRSGGHLGPVEPLPPPLPPPPGPSFFAYLRAENGPVDAALLGLANTGLPHEAYLAGADAPRRQRLRAAGVNLSDTPLSLDEALARAHVVVHHGGVLLSQAALAAGRPQVLLPAHLENTLNAQAVVQRGVGLMAQTVGPGIEALRRLVAEPAWMSRAQQVAQGIQARGPWDALGPLLARCKALLGQGPAPPPLRQ